MMGYSSIEAAILLFVAILDFYLFLININHRSALG